MTTKRKAIGGSLFFIWGIFLANFFSFDWLLFVPTLVVFLSLYVTKKNIIFLWLTLCLLAIVRGSVAGQTPSIAYGYIEVRGNVIQTTTTLYSQQLTVSVDENEVGLSKLLVFTRPYPPYEYGDVIEIQCEIERPEPIEDFAYDKYLALQKIYATCSRPAITFIQHNNSLQSYVLRVKRFYSQQIERLVPDPEADIVRAMLLAERKEIPQSLQTAFSYVGLSHMIAISGLHIALIIALLRSGLAASGLQHKSAFIVTSVFLLTYLFVIGFPASAVRASLLAGTMLLGFIVQRRYDGLYVLLLVAAGSTFINPLVLRYDIGWQLSFLAVAGLFLWHKHIVSWLMFIRWASIRELIAVTLSAQVFTWPLIAYYFKVISWVAPLVNVIVIPVLPLIIVGGIIMPLVALIPGVSLLVRPLMYSVTHYIVWVAQSVSRYGGYALLPDFNWIFCVGGLLAMVVATVCLKRYEKSIRNRQ